MSSFDVNPNALVNFCKDIISRAIDIPLNGRKPKVEIKPDDANKSYTFRDSNSLEQKKYGDKDVSVIKIDEGLFLGANISFQRKGGDRNKFEFKSISLQFFHNDFLFCKAEWSCADNVDEITDHPQPHWHFIQHNITLESDNSHNQNFNDYLQEKNDENENYDGDFVTFLTGVNAQEDKDNEIDLDISRMHFAMDSMWHLKPNDWEPVTASPKVIKYWLENCLTNIKAEHRFRYKGK